MLRRAAVLKRIYDRRRAQKCTLVHFAEIKEKDCRDLSIMQNIR